VTTGAAHVHAHALVLALFAFHMSHPRNRPLSDGNMFRRLFGRQRHDTGPETPMVNRAAARVPAGVRLYVIGDIHGRIDLLQGLQDLILEDVGNSSRRVAPYAIYLGDYVDRGFESRRVLDHLIEQPLPGFASVHLLGNHDAWLRDFVVAADAGPSWVRFGGDATLLSYGIRLDPQLPENERFAEASELLAERIPDSHLDFLHRLEVGFSFGDYFFCHAGVRPEVALERQIEPDLIWIREPFLRWNGDCGKVVVHGHTVEQEPVVRHNRIGIDTGACWTNVLTCLVLEGDQHRFIST